MCPTMEAPSRCKSGPYRGRPLSTARHLVIKLGSLSIPASPSGWPHNDRFRSVAAAWCQHARSAKSILSPITDDTSADSSRQLKQKSVSVSPWAFKSDRPGSFLLVEANNLLSISFSFHSVKLARVALASKSYSKCNSNKGQTRARILSPQELWAAAATAFAQSNGLLRLRFCSTRKIKNEIKI